MKYDVAAIGELLIDFTPSGVNESGIALFGRNPGGAPANVLALLARLGSKTAFIGKVGDDDFGHFLKKTLIDNDIDTTGLIMSGEYNTTLAFVQLNEQGDRSFSFYRKPGADLMLRDDELNKEIIEGCKVFHFGSVSLTDEPSRSATLAAVKMARDKGRIISYDPNYRPLLWNDEAGAIRQMRDALEYADIVKVSDNEVCLLSGETDYLAGARKIIGKGAALVFVTAGENGTYYCTSKHEDWITAFKVTAIDTTGAGDAFMGAALYHLKDKSLDEIKNIGKQELEKIVRFANAAGGLTATKRGAIPAMPGMGDIMSLITDAKL